MYPFLLIWISKYIYIFRTPQSYAKTFPYILRIWLISNPIKVVEFGHFSREFVAQSFCFVFGDFLFQNDECFSSEFSSQIRALFADKLWKLMIVSIALLAAIWKAELFVQMW